MNTEVKRPTAIQNVSPTELAGMGAGELAYIRVLSTAEAQEMFPAVKDLPEGIDLYALHAADGRPLALTDSHDAAVGHARGDDLELRSIH